MKTLQLVISAAIDDGIVEVFMDGNVELRVERRKVMLVKILGRGVRRQR